MTKKTFYITTAIPYVNAAPHIGFALELVQADTIARYQRLIGKDVRFLTGSDENSLKNVQAAEKEKITVKELVDRNSKKFYELKDALNVSFDDFIRTTEKRHIQGARALWKACNKSDIYKKKYKGLYCVGCESFYLEKDLIDGKCPEHKTAPEVVQEINYFFRLSKYQKWLENLVAADELKITPETRKNEILSFIRQGLEDFSISRSKKRAKGWGITVPDDWNQIIYVWFDALSNYITALDWQKNSALFKKYWPANLHVIGKGITRFHAIYWPAMLKSAGLVIPKEIFVHGYITAEHEKISKSLGNVIDPFDLVKKYGTDAVRYYLLREIPAYGDGDFSIQRFIELYNSDLANGLGNLVQRVAKIAENFNLSFADRKPEPWPEIYGKLDVFNFGDALSVIWQAITNLDQYLSKERPWESESKAKEVLSKIIVGDQAIKGIREIAFNLKPFLPETAERIERVFTGSRITKPDSALFPRIS